MGEGAPRPQWVGPGLTPHVKKTPGVCMPERVFLVPSALQPTMARLQEELESTAGMLAAKQASEAASHQRFPFFIAGNRGGFRMILWCLDKFG